MFLVAAAFVLLLAVAAVAVLPVRVLPARVAGAVDGRRETLVFVALCALSFSVVLVFFVALASA